MWTGHLPFTSLIKIHLDLEQKQSMKLKHTYLLVKQVQE